MPVYDLASLSTTELAALKGPGIVILPLAATEPHGPHLPLSTDTDIAQGHLNALQNYEFDQLNILIMPIEHIGFSLEHKPFIGMLSGDSDGLVARWVDLIKQMVHWGHQRFILINSHGGNSPLMELLIQQIRRDLGVLAVATSWFRFGQPEGLFCKDELDFGIHGGAIETSLMLHYCPHKVRQDECTHFISKARKITQNNHYLRPYGKVSMGWQSNDFNEAGVMGDATAASAQKGAQSAHYCVAAFARLIHEVAAFDLDMIISPTE